MDEFPGESWIFKIPAIKRFRNRNRLEIRRKVKKRVGSFSKLTSPLVTENAALRRIFIRCEIQYFSHAVSKKILYQFCHGCYLLIFLALFLVTPIFIVKFLDLSWSLGLVCSVIFLYPILFLVLMGICSLPSLSMSEEDVFLGLVPRPG